MTDITSVAAGSELFSLEVWRKSILRFDTSNKKLELEFQVMNVGPIRLERDTSVNLAMTAAICNIFVDFEVRLLLTPALMLTP